LELIGLIGYVGGLWPLASMGYETLVAEDGSALSAPTGA
jgi:hypothetical protein